MPQQGGKRVYSTIFHADWSLCNKLGIFQLTCTKFLCNSYMQHKIYTKTANTSCQKVWDKLLRTCDNLIDIIRHFASLLLYKFSIYSI